MRIMMTTVATATMMTTTDILAAITVGVFGELGVEVGVTTLVEVRMVALVDVGMVVLVETRAQTGSLTSLILTGQSGSNLIMKTPVVIVAPCLTQSSI